MAGKTKNFQQGAKKPAEVEASTDAHLKAFNESLIKFTDSLVVSTSSNQEEIQVWEPKTLAPYEPILDQKFYAAENCLSVNSSNFIWAAHAQKSLMNVWRWDKKDPLLRFPLREQLSAFATVGESFCVGGDKKGRITLWQMTSGEVLADVESAHYMQVTDLDINESMIISGGKDCKVKVWMISSLLSGGDGIFAEFGDHTAEIT